MSFTLDGQSLFSEEQTEIEYSSFKRESIERAVAGLDGVISIDMGGRSRQIKQKGVLRAASKALMDEKTNAISAYMDGAEHTLVTDSGEEINNLRMDVFKVSKKRTSGSGMCCDYEIVYTQLAI